MQNVVQGIFNGNPSGTESPDRRRVPEILAPAGNFECIRAAVENGADAVYFGLSKFNARMRADNITLEKLPEVMGWLRRRGVRGYITFNTLVFADELPEALNFLRACAEAQVDAIIVQDLGIARLARELSPDLPIHASTQMTLTSAEAIRWVSRFVDFQMFVLARELSVKEINRLHTQIDVPLEVFVHGALCVAYSGQCLTSESLGGRSANRGECAQACRMPYDLLADGKQVDLQGRHYLLSPQDLAGYEYVKDLIENGVVSLKIEGRLKSPEYVAGITRVYRKALDAAIARQDKPEVISSEDRYSLEMSFSRGLYSGWLGGINNQELVHARFGKKRGVLLGEVEQVRKFSVVIHLQAPLKKGDGIVFDSGHPEADEEGARVWDIRPCRSPNQVELFFGPNAVDFQRIDKGDKIWKTDDPELNRQLRTSFEGETPRYKRKIHMEVRGSCESPFILKAMDEAGHSVEVESAVPLARAQNRPLTMATLQEQLGRLGNTAFELGELKNLLEGEVILPVSELNRMRREAVERLEKLLLGRTAYRIHTIHPDRWQLRKNTTFVTGPSAEMSALVRTPQQLSAALGFDLKRIYVDYEDPKKYREAVTSVKTHRGDEISPRIFLATTRIQKPGEDGMFRQLASYEPDGILIRNLGAMEFFHAQMHSSGSPLRFIGDFSLNIANPLTAQMFKDCGLDLLTASYDLNFEQVAGLLRTAPPEWFEITLHQHMPMFHMEHCIFCAFLTKGTDFRDCGRPCDTTDVKLRDRVGMEHPVKADVGCRNTVFNAVPQSGAEYFPEFRKLGVRSFRIEFVNEAADEIQKVLHTYRRLLSGDSEPREIWRSLKVLNQLGVTRGQMNLEERARLTSDKWQK